MPKNNWGQFEDTLVGELEQFIPPIPTEKCDPLAKVIRAEAVGILERRAEQYQRRSRWILLLIGFIGYFSAALTLLFAGNFKGPSIAYNPMPTMESLPAPDPAMVAVVMAVAIVWIGLVALFTRGRAPALSHNGNGV
jgi:hypothetical protein